jgi:hypothetical protein
MLTPRVLGTCSVLLLQVLCRMKKLIGGVKGAFSSGPSSRGSSSRFGDGSQDFARLLVVIKCIYLPSTYLYSVQDIEDRCLLLTSSTSFVDLPLQEHQMTEKHHMDRNLYISQLCPKLGVFTDNMTRRDDMAQGPSPVDPKWGRPDRSCRISKTCFHHVSK